MPPNVDSTQTWKKGNVPTFSEQTGSLVVDEKNDLTTTRYKISLPSGGDAIEISYHNVGAAASTSKGLYFVLNATSDADADGKLALAGARQFLLLGDSAVVLADPDNPITRIDCIAHTAESGNSKLMILARIAA